MAAEHKKWTDEVPQNMNERRRPFDTSELDKLPSPRADDPPYRPWWVVTEHWRTGER